MDTFMKAKEVMNLFKDIPTPVAQIEHELEMPKTTLQKAIKGKRDLPKRWDKAVIDYLKKHKNAIYKPIKK
jgi:hypothetical protein